MPRNFLLAVLVVLAGTACQAPWERGIMGYVGGGTFHPLVLFEGGQLVRVEVADLQLEELLAYRVNGDTTSIQLGQQERYVDRYTDENGIFAHVAIAATGYPFFAYTGAGAGVLVFRPDTAATRSFYRVFAQDPWGRQFFGTSDLDGPLPEITAESKVRTHGVTDVDRDGRLEIWVTYRLMWGEVGAMGWEETGTGWTRFAIHCFDCD